MNERLIVIVTRALPVDGKTDIVAGTFDEDTPLRELATWAREKCQGCAMISIEVCFDATQPTEMNER